MLTMQINLLKRERVNYKMNKQRYKKKIANIVKIIIIFIIMIIIYYNLMINKIIVLLKEELLQNMFNKNKSKMIQNL